MGVSVAIIHQKLLPTLTEDGVKDPLVIGDFDAGVSKFHIEDTIPEDQASKGCLFAIDNQHQKTISASKCHRNVIDNECLHFNTILKKKVKKIDSGFHMNYVKVKTFDILKCVRSCIYEIRMIHSLIE